MTQADIDDLKRWAKRVVAEAFLDGASQKELHGKQDFRKKLIRKLNRMGKK